MPVDRPWRSPQQWSTFLAPASVPRLTVARTPTALVAAAVAPRLQQRPPPLQRRVALWSRVVPPVPLEAAVVRWFAFQHCDETERIFPYAKEREVDGSRRGGFDGLPNTSHSQVRESKPSASCLQQSNNGGLERPSKVHPSPLQRANQCSMAMSSNEIFLIPALGFYVSRLNT